MITLVTHNFTNAVPEPRNDSEFQKLTTAMDEWTRRGTVQVEYLDAVVGGSAGIENPYEHILGRAGSERSAPNPGFDVVAKLMQSDRFFVAETERGWHALEAGEYSDLDAIKKRLGDR